MDATAGCAGLGLGAVIGLTLSGQPLQTLNGAASQLTFLGRLTGMPGAYALLIVVLLAGRLPIIERTIGQDRLLAWHRRLAPWALGLILAHVGLTLAGYAAQARTGIPHQAWQLISGTPGMLAAAAGTGLLIAAGVTSYRRARRHLAHETWWAIHLYTYLGLALSLTHQLSSGAAFATTPWARTFWLTLWLGTAGLVLTYRVLVPLARSAYHQLRVEAVAQEAPGVVSVTLRGRGLDRLPAAGGQFLHWRFLQRGLWWQAHPYSLSALPSNDRLRITVKDLGDHSQQLAALRPGTPVAVEGPYGAFTAHHAQTAKALLIGAGVGITPIRSLLEDLPTNARPIVLVRGRDRAALPHLEELRSLTRRRGGTLVELVGPRHDHPLDAEHLTRLAPDLADRDVYVCGPPAFTQRVLAAAAACGVPAEQLHHESLSS